MSLLLPTKGKGEGGKLENLTVHITLWQIYIYLCICICCCDAKLKWQALLIKSGGIYVSLYFEFDLYE